ncbi:MAG TPA: phosphatase PAP2 family protein [Gaiella sp.]|uniref:phosphatase PAP2 family protein n=1 Tax=Gaiella sp. TaxID=2663207 RepID=UPI002D8037D3|nr:phosphatase PAP2 family protein [Gaiella sp.]HET9287773.1 phosphatase PAP2 family protein [Gaiella sp.]
MTSGGPSAPLGERGATDGTAFAAVTVAPAAPAPATDDRGRAAGEEPGTQLGGPTWLLLALLSASLGLYAGIAADVVHNGRLAEVDVDIATWVAGSMPSWAEWLARPFTWVGGLVGATAVVVAAATWLLVRSSRAQALILLVAAGGIQLLVMTGKEGYDRPRPDVGSAIDLPSSFSFPSGHAATGIAVFGLLGLLASIYARTRAARIAAVVAGFALGAAIGASRVVLNVHYLSDVLAGACLGFAWLVTCILLVRLARRLRS